MPEADHNTDEFPAGEGGSNEPPSPALEQDPSGFDGPAVQLPMLQMGFSLTQGPLPSPDVMREYDHVDQNINISLLDDFNRRSVESIEEATHRRNIETHFMHQEERELQLRIDESAHSRMIGNRASIATPFYIGGGYLLLLIMALFAPLEGAALASVLIAAIIGGCGIVVVAILRGPMGAEEGKTISSVAKSIVRGQSSASPSDDSTDPNKA